MGNVKFSTLDILFYSILLITLILTLNINYLISLLHLGLIGIISFTIYTVGYLLILACIILFILKKELFFKLAKIELSYFIILNLILIGITKQFLSINSLEIIVNSIFLYYFIKR
jgi:hypothetical protein